MKKIFLNLMVVITVLAVFSVSTLLSVNADTSADTVESTGKLKEVVLTDGYYQTYKEICKITGYDEPSEKDFYNGVYPKNKDGGVTDYFLQYNKTELFNGLWISVYLDENEVNEYKIKQAISLTAEEEKEYDMVIDGLGDFWFIEFRKLPAEYLGTTSRYVNNNVLHQFECYNPFDIYNLYIDFYNRLSNSDFYKNSTYENKKIIPSALTIDDFGGGGYDPSIESTEDTTEITSSESITESTENTTEISTEPTTEATQIITEISTEATTEKNENAAKLGDVNEDGKINSVDAVVILQVYAADLAGADTSKFKASNTDINGDGETNSKDAVVILKYYAEELANVFSGTMEEYLKK